MSLDVYLWVDITTPKKAQNSTSPVPNAMYGHDIDLSILLDPRFVVPLAHARVDWKGLTFDLFLRLSSGREGVCRSIVARYKSRG